MLDTSVSPLLAVHIDIYQNPVIINHRSGTNVLVTKYPSTIAIPPSGKVSKYENFIILIVMTVVDRQGPDDF